MYWQIWRNNIELNSDKNAVSKKSTLAFFLFNIFLWWLAGKTVISKKNFKND